MESEFTETTNNDISVISGVISDMGMNQAHKSSVFSSNMLRAKSINLAPNPIANKSHLQKPRRSNDRLTNFVNEFAYSLGLDPKMFVHNSNESQSARQGTPSDYDQVSVNTGMDIEKLNTSIEVKEILNLHKSVTQSQTINNPLVHSQNNLLKI